MIPRDQAVEAGTITRKWGFEGEVLLKSAEEFAHLKKLPESVFVEIQGRLVPFLVLSARRQGAGAFVVLLADSAPPVLERLLQATVWLLRKDLAAAKKAAYTAEDPEGYEVVDKTHGTIGTVKEVWSREEQPLLVVTSHGKEILIPMDPGIIRRTDHKKRRIHIEAPEGLIDMYLNP
ncbi:MAG TPA: PRC-barrel domain-containing protein [Bacteroidales bacterium]|nr:PRC-barrel domain-containing protein [Bacteroidales bacterium]HRZ48369.1 PRC-barrel domain-containing protein [Bacteroidales bacterium]